MPSVASVVTSSVRFFCSLVSHHQKAGQPWLATVLFTTCIRIRSLLYLVAVYLQPGSDLKSEFFFLRGRLVQALRKEALTRCHRQLPSQAEGPGHAEVTAGRSPFPQALLRRAQARSLPPPEARRAPRTYRSYR